MLRMVAFASLLAVLLFGLGMNRGELATAQEATSDTREAMASHPIVGTWRFVRDFGEGPAVSYGIFHPDGTYLQEAYVDGPLNFGVWQPTGERTAELRFHQLYLWDDRVVEGEARYAFTVDERGDTLDGPGVYVSRYADDGAIEFTFETTTSTGTRVVAAPLVSLETLITETEISATPSP